MNNNQDRVLSLVLKITDPEKAKWIWDYHLREKPFKNELGVEIWGITDGDLQEEVSRLEELKDCYE